MSHSLLASDHHHSDADAEDHDSVPGTRPQLPKKRPKERSHRPSSDGVEEAAPKAKAPKVRRKKPKPSQARKAAKSTGGGSKRRQANAVTSPDTESFLQFVGAECEWTDALLALGTKELNDVLRKGNYTPAQIQELKSSRRRAKNRTYALRSRQKKGGKEQAPCPGPESAQEVFEAAAEAAASAARSRARKLRGSAKQPAETQPGGGAGAAVAETGPAAAAPGGAGAEAADTAGPAVGLGGVGLTSEYADKMLLAESDEDDESLELLQFLAEGHARSGTGYPDYPDPASDTGSHTDTSNSGWGSSSYTDSYSESYSESNDAFDSEYDSVESMELAPDFEMSGLSLSDPVAPVVSPMTAVKQQQPPPTTLLCQQPQPDPPLNLGHALGQPASLELGQPNELEAMLADLRSNYSAVHRKLDKFAVGLPSAGDGGRPTGGRHSRSTTPTPGDNPATAIPVSVAADPLFLDLKSGFENLNAKMDSWLNPDGVGAAASTPTLPSQGTVFDYGAPAMEIEPRDRVYSLGGSSSYDHFMAGMMGGSSGVPPI